MLDKKISEVKKSGRVKIYLSNEVRAEAVRIVGPSQKLEKIWNNINQILPAAIIGSHVIFCEWRDYTNLISRVVARRH